MNSTGSNSSQTAQVALRRGGPSRYSSKDLKTIKCLPPESKRPISVSRLRKSFKSLFSKSDGEQAYVFVTIGVSTETGKRKVYPSLWNLFKRGQLPRNIRFYAFSRSASTKDELRDRIHDYMRVEPQEEAIYEEFWSLNNHYVGCYLSRLDYDSLHKELLHSDAGNIVTNRLFYMAIPNTFLESVTQNLRTLTQTRAGWTRVMTEKPFGKDVLTSAKVTQYLLSLCSEEDLFRIDSFLCKDIVQNILTIRFCNLLFSSSWNRKMIETVEIIIKDSASTRKGRYVDSYGIICDVVQLQGLQLLALIAMEKPISMKPDDVRDEKVKLLKCIAPVTMDNIVLGQYMEQPVTPTSKESRTSYNYSEEVDPPKNCNSVPTFCALVIQINNERWDGVPFILRCGKGVDELRSEIRIRYQKVPADIFKTRVKRNELVIQIEPVERLFIKAVTKIDNNAISNQDIVETEIPLNSDVDFNDTNAPYDHMLRDVISGLQTNFIRTAEMKQAWRIFMPLLTKMEKENIEPIRYHCGTPGPPESDRLIRKYVPNDDMWTLAKTNPM